MPQPCTDRHSVKLVFKRGGDSVDAFLDGQYVGYANYDEHGSAGMNALERAMAQVAKVLNAEWEVEEK